MANTPEYNAWVSMRQRCRNSNNPWYHRYGGRGIKICKRWDKFETFILDMGIKPTPKHSINRIDNDQDYTPDNCEWATQRDQCLNMGVRKDNKLNTKGIVYDSERLSYRAYYYRDGKQYFVGRFKLLEDAMQARKETINAL